jgi:hypothetical protein
MESTTAWLAALVVGLGAAGAMSACFDPLSDCTQTKTCPVADAGKDGGDACAGDPTTEAAIVNDGCGVFVNASAAPGGDGKEATPFQTFAEAAAAKPARVFACAGTYAETMTVSFTGGVEVYGGFTGCTGTSWTWSTSAEAQITTPVDVTGWVLNGGTNKLENVSVTAPGATMPGGSSIAVLVNGGALDMTNGALTAGDGQKGADGATGNAMSLDGTMGASGASTCDPGAIHTGPAGAVSTCSTGGTSTAGNGGDGGDPGGDPAATGSNGGALPTASAVGVNDGKGGQGEGQGGALLCVRGDDGAPGVPGTPGDGAGEPGSITANGYEGVAGKDGTSGAPGQGGGGGGGAKGGAAITCGSTTTAFPGASGGAGGTGGCGGALGSGGKPGGSSIALLVLDAQVTLTSVTLTAGKGGNGGAGGSGQSGGNKGTGGTSGAGAGTANGSCSGGDGGRGGVGGPGGGGQGGYSLGIAFQGTTSPKGGTFSIQMTNAGPGGMGGTNNTTANMGQGADGMAINCWDFGSNAACK